MPPACIAGQNRRSAALADAGRRPRIRRGSLAASCIVAAFILLAPCAFAGGSDDARASSGLGLEQALMRLRQRLGDAPALGEPATPDEAVRLETFLLRQRLEALGGPGGDEAAARRRMHNELWLLEQGARRRIEPPPYRRNPGYGLPTLPE